MRNIFLVIKHEIITMLSKPSFWVLTFIFPLGILILTFGTQLMTEQMIADVGSERELIQGTDNGEAAPALRIGYVDEAGLLLTLPPEMSADVLVAYESAAQAQSALEAGEIKQYYVIAADYLQTGKMVLVDRDFKPLGSLGGFNVMEYIINYNLTNDLALTALIERPMPSVTRHALAPEQANDTSGSLLAFMVPYATMFIFFFVLTMSSGFMLQSVSKEKENRVAEVLLLSLRPRDLVLGKLIGLGAVAFLQMAIWLGGSLFTLENREQLFNVTTAFVLPPGFVAWAIGYFILGYLLYASALGVLGALAPNAREGSQFTIIVMLPLMIPLWLAGALIGAPHSGMAIFLSLFPLTAPVSMMTRLAVGGVPFWQPLLSLGLLALTTYGFVLLAARFFRADTLLSEASLEWKRIWHTLKTDQR